MREMREMGYAPDPFKTIQGRVLYFNREKAYDACELADIFIYETKKYYKKQDKEDDIPFQVIVVAVENIINRVLRTVPENWQSHEIIRNHILALGMIKAKFDPPYRFMLRDRNRTIPRGIYVVVQEDGRKLADIFMDEASKYYKGDDIPFQVIFVATEIIIDNALRRGPAYWLSRGIMSDHILALKNISREELSASLKCPKCRRKGELIWGEDKIPLCGGPNVFKSVSAGFQRSTKHDKGNRFGVICENCKVEAKQRFVDWPTLGIFGLRRSWL